MTLPTGHLDMSLYELAHNMPHKGAWPRASARNCLETGLLVWTHPDSAFQVCLTHNECHCEKHHFFYSILFGFSDGTQMALEADKWEDFSTFLVLFDFTKFLWLSYEDLHAQKEAVEKRYQVAELN